MAEHDPTIAELAERLGLIERRQIRLEISSYVKYGLMLALVVACAWFGKTQVDEADRTHSALCTLRDDLKLRAGELERRAARTEKFLRENPAGIPGVPIKTLREGLTDQKQTAANQRRSVRALGALGDCT